MFVANKQNVIARPKFISIPSVKQACSSDAFSDSFSLFSSPKAAKLTVLPSDELEKSSF